MQAESEMIATLARRLENPEYVIIPFIAQRLRRKPASPQQFWIQLSDMPRAKPLTRRTLPHMADPTLLE
jgi:hypothetical protein